MLQLQRHFVVDEEASHRHSQSSCPPIWIMPTKTGGSQPCLKRDASHTPKLAAPKCVQEDDVIIALSRMFRDLVRIPQPLARQGQWCDIIKPVLGDRKMELARPSQHQQQLPHPQVISSSREKIFRCAVGLCETHHVFLLHTALPFRRRRENQACSNICRKTRTRAHTRPAGVSVGRWSVDAAPPGFVESHRRIGVRQLKLYFHGTIATRTTFTS